MILRATNTTRIESEENAILKPINSNEIQIQTESSSLKLENLNETQTLSPLVKTLSLIDAVEGADKEDVSLSPSNSLEDMEDTATKTDNKEETHKDTTPLYMESQE